MPAVGRHGLVMMMMFEEEEEDADDEDDSDDEILLSLSAILFNNPGKWRLSLYVGHPGSRES